MKPQKIKLFCFGFGQVAENFVKTILLEGLNLEFSVTTRKETNTFKLNNQSYNSYFFDNHKFDRALIKKLVTTFTFLTSFCISLRTLPSDWKSPSMANTTI